jgi:SAM-dependent methyltransferase
MKKERLNGLASREVELEEVDCPVCGVAPNRVWLDDDRPTRYVQCAGCGTVYASPRVSGRVRYSWLDSKFSLSPEVLTLTMSRRPALALEAELIQQHIASGRMLDVGCSVGAFFEFFGDPDWERFGVELAPTAAEYAAQKYASRVHTGTLHSANYRDRCFDLVTLLDTLYHLDDPASEIREISRILKPNGWLAIEIAGLAYMRLRNYGLIPWLIDGKWSRASTDSSYIYWFGPEGLSRLLEKCGLRPHAWYVIPSPRHRSWFLDLASYIHFAVMSYLVGLSSSALTWAPKYLCLAQPVQPGVNEN